MRPGAWALGLLGLVAIAAPGCGPTEAGESSGPAACEGVELLVAMSRDFVSSQVCGAPGSCTSGLDLGGDPTLAASRGRAFFVSRDVDRIFELDPACGTPSPPASLGVLARPSSYANPHDLAVAPDGTLVVTLYNAGSLALVKDGAVTGSIDLSAHDDDGNPQPEGVRVVEVDGSAKAFVTIQRLDDRRYLRSSKPSQMLRVDLATRQVEAVVDLVARNPFNTIAESGSALFLSSPGSFGLIDETDAGIERFDTSTSRSELLVSERELGGSVSEIAIAEGCGAAIVAGIPEANPTSVVTFDPASGGMIMTTAAPALGPTDGYDLYGLAWRGRTLYVGDRRRGPGGYPVHVLEHQGDCRLVDTGRTILLDGAPVALRPAEHAR